MAEDIKKSNEVPESPRTPQNEGIQGLLLRLYLKERQNFPLLLWALVVGLLAGVLAGAFHLTLDRLTFKREEFWAWATGKPLAWIVPILTTGILLTVALFLVRRFAPETSGSGVHEIEGALEDIRPVRWKRIIPIKFLAGLFALGGGMVLGREGPTVQMGGSVGAMIARFFKVDKLSRHSLIAAGAGAGLAAAFNAPLAGILFVIEEMRSQFKFNFLSFQAVLVACAVSDITVRAMTGQAPEIRMPAFSWPPLHSLWIFVVIGSVFGFMGYFFNYFLILTLNFISSWKGGLKIATGILLGGIIGLIGWWLPPAIGGGYEVIPQALQFQFSTGFLLLLFAVRFGTTMVSYGSGAPGGIFAPMLALGTLFGLWFGNITINYFPSLIDHPGIFAVAGMGALFSATVRAPLTGIALAIEMTGNYSQILPLILTCVSATLVAEGLGGRPIYSVLLQRTLTLPEQIKELQSRRY